jgi:hypothetical protein
VPNASLAVVETSNEAVGNVVKRVFVGNRKWVLDSPNPVEPHEPIVLSEREIVAVWFLRGVLFETVDADG